MNKYKCPLCQQEVEHPISVPPEGFRIYGLSIQEIRKVLDFAEQHSYNFSTNVK